MKNKHLLTIIAFMLGFIILRSVLPTIHANNYFFCVLTCIGTIISAFIAFKALRLSNKTFKKQKKATDLQRFETTFFNMLNLQEQIVEGLIWEGLHTEQNPNEQTNKGTVKWEKIKKSGRQVFEYLWEHKWFKFDRDNEAGLDDPIYYCGLKNTLHERGSKEYEEQQSEVSAFDHYFSHMYRIVKFVDNSKCLKDNQKYEYIGILRATLSRFELVWLYYNGLSGAGNKKSKPLVEKYSLLKNLREDLLAYSKDDEIDNEGNISDYDKYMTDEENCTNKYHLQAFVNPSDKGKYEQLCEYYKTKIKSRLRTSQI